MSIEMEHWPRRHRIKVDEYHRMAEVGLLASDARVELIEGEIIEMPPIGTRQATAVDRLTRLLGRAVGDHAIIRCQSPVQLDDFSEPQPALALLAPREDLYEQRHPGAVDTLLVIEVSESTLRYDRHTKMSLYARHCIPELWVVDTEGKKLHAFRCPTGEMYAAVLSAQTPGVIPIGSLPGIEVDLSPLLR